MGVVLDTPSNGATAFFLTAMRLMKWRRRAWGPAECRGNPDHLRVEFLLLLCLEEPLHYE